MISFRKILFNENNTATLERDVLDDSSLGENSVLLRNCYSLISTGTELARLAGTEWYFKLPKVPGYCCVGEIVRKGSSVERFEVGDRIYCFGSHQEYQVVNLTGAVALKIPDGFNLMYAPFIRIFTIAFTAIRVSGIQIGDFAAVIGQGLIGCAAAQLAKLQGASVIGIDPFEKRLGIARSCGVDYVINPSSENAKDAIAEITRGGGVNTLIEAAGNPRALLGLLDSVARGGEVILLGSPRGTCPEDITPLLNSCHLADRDITFKGAHEWKYPILRDKFVKHSMERNSDIVLQYLQDGRLSAGQLLSHVCRPEDAGLVYDGLKNDRNAYMGVIFDWN